MQGFNRYIPPDYDPKQNSTLNSHQGKKHALGVRAKDIDKGILVVRFELPFNIWCESCGNHIGAGVRYNAQKKKVGNYYSTPIYGFKCKCHLCSNWFEIRTDPQNAAYTVYAGAKKKDEDWNPEENGGFATHDTEAPSAAEPPTDAFAATEKTIDQQEWVSTKASRLTELYEASERLSSDPYEISRQLRLKHRGEKKIMLEKQGRDVELREKYGLHDDIHLGDEDVEGGKARWEAGRERAGLPRDEVEAGPSRTAMSASGSVRGVVSREIQTGAPNLVEALRKSTKRKYDPFADVFLSPTAVGNGSGMIPKARGKIKDSKGIEATPARLEKKVLALNGPATPLAGGLLAGYGSD